MKIIFFYTGLTRNLEIGNTPVWGLAIIWRLGQVRDTKFVTSVSNKMLLNAAKCHCYSFYRFWVIKGKLSRGKGERGGGVITPSSRTQIRVKRQPDKLVKHTQTICRPLVSFLLTYNRFYLLLWWFHCWLWIIKYLLGMWSCAFSFY